MTFCSWRGSIQRHDRHRRDSFMPVIRGVPSSRGTSFVSGIPTSLGFVKKKLRLQSRPRARPPLRLLAWKHGIHTRVRRQERAGRVFLGSNLIPLCSSTSREDGSFRGLPFGSARDLAIL
jgi:hypothetical protein